VGEGEYRNPDPVVETTSHTYMEGQNKVTKFNHFATEFDDIVFPFNMAKLEIMEATSRAMALKVFDDLGVMPKSGQSERNADPVIVGHIHLPHHSAAFPASRPVVAFIIAWRLNVRDLDID
jgi:hypothetical protein